MLTILIAPDSLKGSLSASQAAHSLERGARRALGEAIKCLQIPLADGGEGTVEAIVKGAGGTVQNARVRGPLGEKVHAQWAILNDGRAVIEMAQASGLTLVLPEKRDALHASSYGTGELILAALDAGCRKILLGIGGSATTDGGVGALQALGVRFLDADGNELPPGGAALRDLHKKELNSLDARLRDCEITVLCDVTNPLHGPQGAAYIYGPQKGATPKQVQILDEALQNFADVTTQTIGKDYRNVPGAGAAGGIGFGLMSFLDARLKPGIETVLEVTRFAEKLESADLVLTAEGSIDAQTLSGKTIAGLCRVAREAKSGRGVPVIAFGGSVQLSGTQLDDLGLLSAFSLTNAPRSLEECLSNADALLACAAERALRLWKGSYSGAERMT
jgi:glycerate kinase